MATVIKTATMSISKKQETALNEKLQECIEAITKAEKPVNTQFCNDETDKYRVQYAESKGKLKGN